MNKKISGLLITLVVFLISAKGVFALPSLPSQPSQPTMVSAPTVPPTPVFPPCLDGCKTASPTPTATPAPTTSTSTSSGGTSTGGSSDSGSSSGGGQVLGTMAATGVAEENLFNLIFVLGSLLSAFGIRKFSTSRVK